jgi:hypothetical protein
MTGSDQHDRLADIQRHFIEGNERGLVRRDEVVPVVFGDVAWLVAALVAERGLSDQLAEALRGVTPFNHYYSHGAPRAAREKSEAALAAYRSARAERHDSA